MAQSKGIAGALSCWGYGYKAKVLINGKDVGMIGGKSENLRLFSKEHEMYADAPPKIRERLFILKEGDNGISVEFTKASGKESDYLQISLEIEDYPAPVFLLHSRVKPSGGCIGVVKLAESAPKDFKPLFITDQDGGKSVFLHVGTPGCTVTPILNGKEAMTLSLMPGQVVLDNVKPGKNELVARYSGDAGGELQFALMTPEWFRSFVRKIQDDAEKEESFVFNA